MPISDCDVRDPRMKRTRQLLQGALRELLREKRLDEIGVQDITGAATINRATFYDHYTDKFALFQAMIAYRVKNAIIHRFDPRAAAFPDAIHATTRVQRGRLALWLVHRGSSLLPWHGVGAIDGSGRARVMLAEQVAAHPDMEGVNLPGEDTPFYYALSNGRLDLGAVRPA